MSAEIAKRVLERSKRLRPVVVDALNGRMPGRDQAYGILDQWDDAANLARAFLAEHEPVAQPTERTPPIECDGSPYCQAPRHIEGCFAEKVQR